MSIPRPPQAVPLSRRTGVDDTVRIAAYSGPERQARDHWQRLVDARLIGTVTALCDETLTGIHAWERTLGVGRGKRGGVW